MDAREDLFKEIHIDVDERLEPWNGCIAAPSIGGSSQGSVQAQPQLCCVFVLAPGNSTCPTNDVGLGTCVTI